MIRTTIPILINKNIRGSFEAVLYGKINTSIQSNDFKTMQISGYYFYFLDDKEMFLESFEKTLNETDIVLLDQITPILGDMNRVEAERYKHYKGMTYIMSDQYNIENSLIEII